MIFKKFKPKISVIVAAYNCEETLDRCLSSIIKQTIKDHIEIIVVDDGSTDNTVKVAQIFADKNDNIHLYKNQENKGAGFTKNFALKKTTGKYIGFVDSDDFINSTYYEDLYNIARTFNADIACCNIELVYSDKSVKSHLEENTHFTRERLKTKTEIIQSDMVISHWAGASACTKLIRKSLLIKYPFYEGRCCDDIPAVIPSVLSANKIAYCPFQYYHYVQRTGSLENSGFNETRLSVADAIQLTCERVFQLDKGDIACQILYANSVLYTIMELFKTDNDYYIDDFRKRLNPQGSKDNFYLNIEHNNYIKNNLNQWSPIGLRLYYEKAVMLFAKGRLEDLKQHLKEWTDYPERFCPKVSIVIPVYNGANYMRDAVGSALAQTYPNIEVIVVNDGSTDGGETDRIARSYGERIKYIHKQNGGVATALNTGIENMTGEYFAWLSHDDMYTYDKIEREVEFLFQQPDKTVFVAGGYTVIDAKGKKLYDVNLHQQYTNEEINKPLFAVMRGGINGCATLIHKSHFERAGLFNPSLPTTQDYDLWFRILRGKPIAYYAGCFVKSRCHDEQDSKKLLTSHAAECDKLWIGMIETLTDHEKCQISGTVLDFYTETKRFIDSSTGYVNVSAYLYQCIVNEILNLIKDDFSLVTRLAKETQLPKAVLLQDEVKLLIRGEVTKPRIAFLLPYPNVLGGLNKIVLETAGLLTEKYEVLLVVNEYHDNSGYPLNEKVIQICTPPITDGIEIIPKLLSILEVSICINSHNCMPTELSLYSHFRKMGIKSIAWSHEFYFLPYWNISLYNCLSTRNASLAQANAVIWLNSISASFYSQLHGNGVVIPNMLTMAVPENKNKIRHKDLIAVGRFDDPCKGFKQLLQVFKEVSEKNANTELYVVGPYDLSQNISGNENITYKEFIKKLNLPLNRIHFTGWVKDVEQYYAKACLHLMLSKYEGFGLAITEAAAYGVPSFVFEGSGMDDIITDGVDGYIIPQGKVDQMANKIVDLLADDSKLNQMSKATGNIVKRYSQEIILQKWIQVIDLLLEKGMDQQDELNAALSENFTFAPKNMEALYKQAMQEYEACVQKLLTTHMEVTNAEGNVVYYPMYDGAYQQECINMMNSFSWRITKPLRLFRKVQLSLKQNGVTETLKKIKRKLFRR